MKAIVCEMCGSHDLIKKDDVYVCQNCDTKYSTEEAKKLMIEVKTDESEKMQKFLQLARQARVEGNSPKASEYYNKVLSINPNDWEASFYSVYFDGASCKIGEIGISSNRIKNRTISVLKEVKNNTDINDYHKCYKEIGDAVVNVGQAFYQSATNHLINYANETNSINEAKSWLTSNLDMMISTADTILEVFGDKEYALSIYKNAFNCSMRADLNLFKQLTDKIKSLDANFDVKSAINNQSSSKKGCYVATAVYGSYDCPQVWTLRRYRDNKLAKSWYGRTFIHVYYAISPTLVKWFGKTKLFNRLWKGQLDKMVDRLQKEGYSDCPYEDINW